MAIVSADTKGAIVNIDASDICATDGLEPKQLWSSVPEPCGEHRLALAVLEQALEDLTKHRGAIDPMRRQSFRRAYRWLVSEERRWPYSFLNLCDFLDLSSDVVRSLVRLRTVGEGAWADVSMRRPPG
jgi:hypothetical protein